MLQQYFPELSKQQLEDYARMEQLYLEWNAKINVVSRKDTDKLMERHILHALSVAKVASFKAGDKVLDVGTGGGFPGVPLALMFPKVQFTLCDSIGKKIKVVQEVSDALGLSNVKAIWDRAENIDDKFDHVTSRAVARCAKLLPWLRGKVKKDGQGNMEGGIYLLKGGENLQEELEEAKQEAAIHSISDLFEGEFFETKKVVEIKRLSRYYF